MRDKDDVLRHIDTADLVRRLKIQIAHMGTEEWACHCPFHKDDDPSFSINIKTGLWYCHACGEKGNPISLYMRIRGVEFRAAVEELGEIYGVPASAPAARWRAAHQRTLTPQHVTLWEQQLWKNTEKLQWLREHRGYTDETIKAFHLGWNGEHYTIPVYDEQGRLDNVRIYNPGHKPKFRWFKPAEPNLWPLSNLQYSDILLCEGEPDCILANQLGFHAITGTAGAGTFRPDWAAKLAGKKIVICYDIDEAGQAGAERAAEVIAREAAEIRIIQLPITNPPNGDLTDYILQGGTAEQLRELIEATPKFARADSLRASDKPLWQVLEDLHWVSGEKGPKRQTVRPEWRLTEAAIAWLEANGAKFYRDNQQTAYMYWDGALLEIGSKQWWATMAKVGKINAATYEGPIIKQALADYALAEGQRITSVQWSWANNLQHVIYINLHDEASQILRIAPGEIKVWSNGLNPDNIVLGRSDKVKPIQYVPGVSIAETKALFESLILDNLATSDAERTLIGAWTISIFLRHYSQMRPILNFSGDSTSGKTTAAELLATLIYGDRVGKVSTVAANFSDAARNPLILLDNLEMDDMSKGDLQFLITSATGIEREKRAAGTASENIHERADCMIIRTAIEPVPKRELLNRMLTVTFSRSYHKPDFSFSDTLAEIQRHRDRLLSGIFTVLATEVLPRITAGERRQAMSLLNSINHAAQRENEYISLMLLVANAMGWEGYVDKWLTLQDAEAAESAAETSPVLLLLEALADYLDEERYDEKGNPVYPGEEATGIKIDRTNYEETAWECTMRQLFLAFATTAKHRGLKMQFDNPHQLSKRIKDSFGILSQAGWKISEGTTVRGLKKWRFARPYPRQVSNSNHAGARNAPEETEEISL